MEILNANGPSGDPAHVELVCHDCHKKYYIPYDFAKNFYCDCRMVLSEKPEEAVDLKLH